MACWSDRYRVTALHANVLLAPPSHGDQFGVGNSWTRVEWSASAHSVKWLAYPGEQPVLDNNFQSFLTDWGALHRLSGNATHPVYVRGFQHINILDKGFQLGANGGYQVFAEINCGANSLVLRPADDRLLAQTLGQIARYWLDVNETAA